MNKKLMKALTAIVSAGSILGTGSLTAFATDASAQGTAGGTGMALLSTLGLPLLLLAFLYFIMIRPQ